MNSDPAVDIFRRAPPPRLGTFTHPTTIPFQVISSQPQLHQPQRASGRPQRASGQPQRASGSDLFDADATDSEFSGSRPSTPHRPLTSVSSMGATPPSTASTPAAPAPPASGHDPSNSRFSSPLTPLTSD